MSKHRDEVTGEFALDQFKVMYIPPIKDLVQEMVGPVLESIVARMISRMEQTLEYVRLVGLSTTLPNYQDVATFLRVDESKGLLHFDASYRPYDLEQQFIGVTEKKAIKPFQVTSEVSYEKVIDQAGKNQILSSPRDRQDRKVTRDLPTEKETTTQFVWPDFTTREILNEEVNDVKIPA